MTDSQTKFAERAVRRKKLFLGRLTDPGLGIGPRAVIVLLILLNSRQNLRQYRYAGVLESLMGRREPRGPGGKPA